MEPAKKDEIYKQLKSFLYTIVDNDSYDNVCFTYRTSNKLAGQHYKIALNKNLSEELKTFLLCHEAGHIICRHVATRTTLDYEFTERKIRAVYDRLKPLFDGQDIEDMYDIFEDYIFNMLNDWEVNTRFFTEEEVEYWDSLYPEECCSGGPVHHMLPQECGYPPGLTANEYLLLILQNPEQWFQNMAAAGMDMKNKNRRKHKNGTEGGCNTNQSSASEGSDDANMKNHNKQGRDKNKNKQNQNQNQNGQSGGNQQNQQNQNGNNQQNQNGGNQQNGQPQVQQRDGTDAQNQAAANEQHEQNWHDSKQGGSGSSGEQNEQQKDSNKSNSQSGKGSSKEQNDEQNEQNGQGGGQGDENSEGAPEDKNQAGGSNSENSDSQEDGQQSGGGASSEDESEDGEDSQNAAGGSNNEDENSEDEAMGTSDGTDGTDGEDGDSEEKSGSESGDEEGDGAEGNEQPQLTKEQLEELIDKMVQKMVSDYQRTQEAKMAEAKAKQNDMDAGYSRGSGGGSGVALRDEVTNWSDYDGLEKQIRELLVSKCNTTTKRDLLYNYNRGRFSSDVCIPRYRTETTYDEVPMTVLLDVSGSISQSDIVGFCNIFKNVATSMSKKCTIVLWDTELRAIFDSNDEVKPLSGGGTDIGSGIKYINDNMNPADIGSLFVVSDCCDDLEDWMNSYNGTKYCVCWTNDDTIRRYTGSLYDEWMAEWEKVLVHL